VDRVLLVNYYGKLKGIEAAKCGFYSADLNCSLFNILYHFSEN